MLTIFHKGILAYLKTNATPFIYQRQIRRNYIITKKLYDHFAKSERLEIQDGDADCVFT